MKKSSMTAFPTERPIVIAHRGGAALAPENTLSAFRQALELGVDGIELDLQLSEAGELVVVHDMLAPGQSDEAMPRLDAVLDLVATHRPGSIIVVDMKAAPWRVEHRDQGRRLVDAAAPLLGAYPHPEKVMLASFDWGALEYAPTRLPGFATAFHTMAARRIEGLPASQTGVVDRRDLLAHLEDWRQQRGAGIEAMSPLDLMQAAGARIWSCQHHDLTAGAVAKARELGLGVWTWTVNTEADLRRALDLGVDAITTDRPDRVLRYLDVQQWEA
jgi:glycerophosphoryl diester phosphodiesterase